MKHTHGMVIRLSLTVLSVLIANSAFAGTVLKLQRGQVPTLENTFLSLGSNVEESQDWIVQYQSSVTEADKAALKALGVRIFRYLPDDALVVRADGKQLAKVQAKQGVRAILPFKGWVKLSDRLPTLSVFSKLKALPVLVTTFTEKDMDSVLAKISAEQGQILEVDGRYAAVALRESALMALSEVAGVEFVQTLDKVETMEMKFSGDAGAFVDPVPKGDYTDLDGFETGTKIMNMDSIWSAGFTGTGQSVAMADTGLDMGTIAGVSVDFQGAIPAGFNFGIGAQSWEDPMGHGTHVAGSVMSRGTASGGKLRGAAYNAGMIPQGMWSPIVDNLTVPPKLERLFTAAQGAGARLHTNSWGNPRNLGVYDAMAQQVDEYMWNNPDFLAIFAAGNSGVDLNKDGRIDPGSVSTPGTAKNALTVGASENLVSIGGIQRQVKELRNADVNWPAEPISSSKVSDNADGVAMFSSRGPTRDGRLKPELVAPGTNILSNRSHVAGAEVLWGEYNADYVFSGGTSMATPLAAGAAAIVREVLVKKYAQTQPSAALVKATLMHTASDMFPGQYGMGTATQELTTRRPNFDEGYGRVDMKNLANLTASTVMVDSRVTQGAAVETLVQVRNGKLLANLVYTDAPGTPSAGQALVNDLDLIVEGPGGTFGGTDRINNAEIVEQSGLASGTYKVKVVGQKIPMGMAGAQPFALVITAE